MQKKVASIVLLTLLFAGILAMGFKVSPVFAPPVVDGVISPGEYDGGMAVQLVGRWNPSWTVAAYIAWDTDYLYVAVNEHVPGTSGLAWIEFAIDPGPASSYLYAFAIFGTNAHSYVRCPKPPGSWSGQGTGNFSVMSNAATEFRVKYADYGVTYGNTIKLSIDRNNDSSGPPPRDLYGYAAYWPQGAVVYDGAPQPSTWGDVHLGPSGPTTYQLTVNSVPVSGIAYIVDSTPAVMGTPITLDSGSHTITMPSSITTGGDSFKFSHWEDSSTNPVRTINLQSDTVLTATYSNHTIDGVISPGEYAGGMAVQLVGRPNWNPSWTVDAYIAWDTEYLYVAVNEHVPSTSGHKSWIEVGIDFGSLSSYLYAFIIFDDYVQSCNRYTKPSGPWGSIGTGTFLVVSGTATEFRVKYTDYGIALPGDTIKLAIDRNLGPAPPPPFGQAAYWPQNAIVYDGTPIAQPSTWGDVPPQPPHPCQLTVNSVPVSGIPYNVDSTPAVTGTLVTLLSGFHTITMPSTATLGPDSYRFGHWEILSSTNPVRTIDLESDTVLAVTYSNHTIDGVVSPGEYDDGIQVQLIGPYPSGAPYAAWTTDANISWDAEYLYVAVDEPVPASTGSGLSSWIEFQFNTSTALHSFVLFSDGTPQHVLYPLPSGPWGWDVPSGFDYPHPWSAATNTATEFQVKYTDYGIVYGDLLKMSIDRGKDDFNYPPLGECSVWPNPCTFYPTADASTWGNVRLAPLLNPALYITPPLTTKQFGDVGTTFEVTVMAEDMTDLFGFDLNITWDNNLITFDHASYVNNLQAIWGPTQDVNWSVTKTEHGTGYYKFVALSLVSSYTGSHALLTLAFMIQDPHTNWKKQTPLHFETHKLSDSLWHSITHTITDATYEIYGSTPTLNLSPTARTCRKLDEEFEVAVAIYGCENLAGFDFEIHYDTTLMDYVSGTVNYGTGTITPDDLNGKIGGTTTGSASGSLTLVTIRFKAAYNHIWKDNTTILGWQNIVTGSIYIQSAALKYPDPQPDRAYTRGGSTNKINVGADVVYTWSPIQGDVRLDGVVDIFDLHDVAYYYDTANEFYNLTGSSNFIDIFDLVVVATNFGYQYYP